jgi:hypothetical protein
MPLHNNILTPRRNTAIICTVAATVATGRENPDNIGVKAPTIGVFLCPSFRQAFSLANSVMVGCSGQPRGWPVPISGILTPLQSATNAVRSIGGGLSLAI